MTAVLVLGARGKTGREVAAALHRRGIPVRAASREPKSLTLDEAETVRFEWRDPETYEIALAGVSAAYIVKPSLDNAVEHLCTFLDAAERAGLERVALLSEIAAETRDQATDERRAEDAVQSCTLGWAIFRPNWFMQDLIKDDFFLGPIRDHRRLEIPTGGAAISWVDARDIADIAVEALVTARHEGCAYTVTGPEALTLRELVARLSRVLGHGIEGVDQPLDENLEQLRHAGLSAGDVSYMRRVYESVASGAASVVTSVIADLTGRPPRSLEAFVSEFAEAWLCGLPPACSG